MYYGLNKIRTCRGNPNHQEGKDDQKGKDTEICQEPAVPVPQFLRDLSQGLRQGVNEETLRFRREAGEDGGKTMTKDLARRMGKRPRNEEYFQAWKRDIRAAEFRGGGRLAEARRTFNAALWATLQQ